MPVESMANSLFVHVVAAEWICILRNYRIAVLSEKRDAWLTVRGFCQLAPHCLATHCHLPSLSLSRARFNLAHYFMQCVVCIYIKVVRKENR